MAATKCEGPVVRPFPRDEENQFPRSLGSSLTITHNPIRVLVEPREGQEGAPRTHGMHVSCILSLLQSANNNRYGKLMALWICWRPEAAPIYCRYLPGKGGRKKLKKKTTKLSPSIRVGGTIHEIAANCTNHAHLSCVFCS